MNLSFLVASLLVVAGMCRSHPTPAEKDAEFWRNQAKVRATLITKDNFKIKHPREEKSGLVPVPEPFVISTALNVDNGGSSSGRSGRSGFESQKSPDEEKSILVEGVRVPDDESDRVTHRNGRFINNVFVPNGASVPAETVVVSDNGFGRQPKLARQAKMFGRRQQPQTTQRRRRVMRRPANNHGFADRYGERLDSLAVESSRRAEVRAPAPAAQLEDSGESRDYSYHAGQTNAGRPVYYVVEDDDELHSDRSPYHFEPADTHTSFSSAVSDYTQAGTAGARPHGAGGGAAGGLLSQLSGASTPADSNDFIIKEHTYTMCPGCPTFSIPIPIPKSTLKQQSVGDTLTKTGPGGYPTYDSKVDYQFARNKTFLQKIGDQIVSTVGQIQSFYKTRLIDPIVSGGAGLFAGDDNGVDDDAEDAVEEKVDSETEEEEKQDGFNSMPLVVGGLAAAGLGAFVLMENLAPLLTKADVISADSSSSSSRSLKVVQEQEAVVMKAIQESRQKFEDR